MAQADTVPVPAPPTIALPAATRRRPRTAHLLDCIRPVLGPVPVLFLRRAAIPRGAPAAGQVLRQDLSNQEILDLLRQSGKTPQQIRGGLERRILPLTAANLWLPVLEGRASQMPEGTDPPS